MAKSQNRPGTYQMGSLRTQGFCFSQTCNPDLLCVKGSEDASASNTKSYRQGLEKSEVETRAHKTG
jgi:hypothetical protein